MNQQLQQLSALPQKDKAAGFTSLVHEIIARPDQSAVAQDIHALVDTVVNQDSVGLVVGRQVLSELVKILGEGAIKNPELRKAVVEDTLALIQPRIVSYEEQASGDHDSILGAKFTVSFAGEHSALPARRYSRGGRRMERSCPRSHGHLARLGSTVRSLWQSVTRRLTMIPVRWQRAKSSASMFA